MRPELKAVVAAGSLRRAPDGPFSHAGRAGGWDVRAGLLGMGPSTAEAATERVLTAGPFDHVMVVGIAGGLGPELPVGALMVPSVVRLHPDGPPRQAHPVHGARTLEGTLLTTDGLFSDDDIWEPLAASGVGALDMEASGVAEACERAGVPWTIYRGISDRPDEHLVDQAVFALSKPDGSADMGAALRYILRDPRRVKALAHLNRCMQVAARVAADAAFEDLSGS
jgi:nucleoside phosphorylase